MDRIRASAQPDAPLARTDDRESVGRVGNVRRFEEITALS